MSLPPPYNPNGPESPGHSGGPLQHGPAGQPQGFQPAGQPQWASQPQWAGGRPPPRKGGKGKWILVGLALVVAVVVGAAGAVIMLSPASDDATEQASSTGEVSDFASANDTGPADIIIDDPTCEAWGRLSRNFAAEAKSVKWADRDPDIPASAWTSEQRTIYETVGKALTTAADSAGTLAKRTPHRVMRELYGQFIAYSQAFVQAIPSYEPTAHPMANATGATISALNAICSAIDYKAVQPIAPLVPEPDGPPNIAAIGGEPQRFLTDTNPVCQDWIVSTEQYDKDAANWIAVDPNIPASQWTPEQKSAYDAVGPVMTLFADSMDQLGRDSGNAVLEDLAVLGAQYMRAFVITIPDYTASDSFLSNAAINLGSAVYWSCKAVS